MYAETNNKKQKKSGNSKGGLAWLYIILACLLVIIPTGFIVKQCVSSDNATKGDTKYKSVYENLLNSLKAVENNIARLLVFDNDGSNNYKIATIDSTNENLYYASLTIKDEYKENLFSLLEENTIDLGEHFESYVVMVYEVVDFKEFEVEAELDMRLTYYGTTGADDYICVTSYIEKNKKPLLESPKIYIDAPASEDVAPEVDLTELRKIWKNEANLDIYNLNKYMLNQDMKSKA